MARTTTCSRSGIGAACTKHTLVECPGRIASCSNSRTHCSVRVIRAGAGPKESNIAEALAWNSVMRSPAEAPAARTAHGGG